LPLATYTRDVDGFEISEVPTRKRKRDLTKKVLAQPEEVAKPKREPPGKLIVEPEQTPIWQAFMNTQDLYLMANESS
jgi:hypothetical protein